MYVQTIKEHVHSFHCTHIIATHIRTYVQHTLAHIMHLMHINITHICTHSGASRIVLKRGKNWDFGKKEGAGFWEKRGGEKNEKN